LVLEVEKTLKEHSDKLEADDIKKTEEALEVARTTLKEKADDGDALEKAAQDLIQASHKVAEIIYKQKGGQEGQPGAGEQSTGDADEKKNDKPGDDQEPIDTDIS